MIKFTYDNEEYTPEELENLIDRLYDEIHDLESKSEDYDDLENEMNELRGTLDNFESIFEEIEQFVDYGDIQNRGITAKGLLEEILKLRE